MRLSKPAKLTDFVDIVHMAEADNADFEGSNCYITGWGRIDASSSVPLPDILQEAKVDVYSHAQCSGIWGNKIGPYHICVGTSTSGACMVSNSKQCLHG